ILKKRVRQLNRTPTSSETVFNNIRQVVREITNHEWKNCVGHAIKSEDQYTTLPPVAPVIIHLNHSSSSSDDSESDSS
ncbi:unnamed protein product, partial [Callosobruchus maculatus]